MNFSISLRAGSRHNILARNIVMVIVATLRTGYLTERKLEDHNL